MSIMDRPKRPRNHQIETSSRKAFEAMLPDSWVVREKTNDYGIDVEVEIFKDDIATGILFLVQLKATDSEAQARSVPLKLSTLGYMEDLLLPVLIVRYSVPSGSMYMRWAHTIGVRPDQENQKEVTISFSEALGESSFEEIFRATRAFRRYFLSGNPLPLELELHLSDELYVGTFSATLLRELKVLADSLIRIVQIESSSHSDILASHSAISMSFDNIEVFIAGRRLVCLTCNSLPTAPDLMVAIGMVLWEMQLSNEASLLLDRFIDMSQAAQNELVLVSLVKSLIASGRPEDALARIELLVNSEFESELLATIGSMILRGTEQQNKDFLLDHYIPFLEKQIDNSEVVDQKDIAATLSYNLGNVLHSVDGSARTVVGHYRRASQLNPDYLSRSYWWSELGGVLFEAGRFPASVNCYRKAVALGSRDVVSALLADALLFAGQYAQSVDAFKNYFNKLSLSVDPEKEVDSSSTDWCLKAWCLEVALEELKIKEGPPKGKLLDSYRGAPDDIEAMTSYLKSQGILHPRIWFNLGVSYNLRLHNQGAMICFLMAGLIEPADIEAWGNCLVLALNLSEDNLFQHIASEAIFRHGDDFIEHFVENILGKDSNIEVKERKLIRRQLLALKAPFNGKLRPIEVRFG